MQQHVRNCWHAVSALGINHNYLNASRVGEASNPGPKQQAGLQAFVQQAVQKALQQVLSLLALLDESDLPTTARHLEHGLIVGKRRSLRKLQSGSPEPVDHKVWMLTTVPLLAKVPRPKAKAKPPRRRGLRHQAKAQARLEQAKAKVVFARSRL